MSIPHPEVPAPRAVVPEGDRVEVLGGRTAYWTYGPADAAVTVLAVHGFRGDHHGLAAIIGLLPDMRVIVPDLPGFGDSTPLPGRRHDIDAYRAWLTALHATLAPEAVILGHSFGSIVASAAVAGGLPTSRLILINPIGAPALEGPRGLLTRLAVLYYRMGARLPRPAGEWVLRQRAIVRGMSVAMAKTRRRDLRRYIHDQHDRYFSRFADRDVLREAFETSVGNDVRVFAPEIAQPTLLIVAERDDITPLAAQRRLRTLFPRAELVEIPEVGHLIHYETPGPAAAAITRFLAPSAADTR
ncbi:pimeloyl-ACP methyl ester carboxylesterase [Microbacterium sp. SLBN-154]|uniref:alpha/beta fold hydrolase n=1 Tax=Microbacterium sp. SLBN-154 TaxID=2768458 RepID=UPI001167E364|nr:pimeloyl-ACP methyl ester carboxylesterase [Microbacterium sp. SLBN-154]